MYIKYADRTKICEKLAAYHVGDIVVALTNIEGDEGKIEAHTKLDVKGVRIRDGIYIPTIPECQLCNYTSDCDEYNFIYILMPIAPDTDDYYDNFSSSEFIKADEIVDEDFQSIYHAKEKKRKKAATKYWVKGISIMAAGCITYTAIIMLLFVALKITFPLAVFPAFGYACILMLFSMLNQKISSIFIKLISSHCIAKRKDR